MAQSTAHSIGFNVLFLQFLVLIPTFLSSYSAFFRVLFLCLFMSEEYILLNVSDLRFDAYFAYFRSILFCS